MTLEAVPAELAPKMGAVLQVSPWITMPQERIARFADALHDLDRWANRRARGGPRESERAHGAVRKPGVQPGTTPRVR